jgi:hypothetical protein
LTERSEKRIVRAESEVGRPEGGVGARA